MNQRGGYYIPAGTKYNTLSWTEAGTTDKAYPVVGYSGQDPLINVNGTNYIVGKAAQIPGYCAAGNTVDRWKLDIGEAVTLEDGCICLKKTGTYWGQYFDNFEQFIGMTLTGSVLLSDGTLRTGTFVYNGVVNQGQTFFSSEIGFYIQKLSDSLTQCEINSNTDNVKIKAAKLELGNQQTLAHKENGVWVLNEIPDYGEQLMRCLRYYIVTGANHFFSGWCTTTEKFWTHIPTPVPMRAIPAISVIKPGNIIFGTSGANFATSANQYEIESADAAGIKMAVNIAGLTLGAGVLCDGKYAFSADL